MCKRVIMMLLFLVLCSTSCTVAFPTGEQELEAVSREENAVRTGTPEAALTRMPAGTTTLEPDVVLDPAYYEGIVVITRYYTYLGHGLHEEAYGLLSEDQRRYRSLEEYCDLARDAFRIVDIISIMPFHESVRLQGGRVTVPDTPLRKRYAVQIKAWGEGAMSGSRMSGELQLLFITLILENGEWRIDGFATSP